ncbi:MAG: hypothetical protein KF901_00710 [Myxococcales bacterium]|nr:hypothetical protein [Myxococcales bacterium]
MERPPSLPLPLDALPEALRRFASPEAPTPAKMMAAKGMVPVKGGDLVIVLAQLAADADAKVAEAASGTLDGLPPAVLLPACAAPLPASVLDELAERFRQRDEVLEPIIQNPALADGTLAHIARYCSERMSELIAVNQQRLLGAPDVIEALYKNKHTRMSTADRLIELCARHGVELKGIPAFQAHVEAISGQLIPEPTDEPLPTDTMFAEVLAESSDEDAVDIDAVEGTETLKEKFKPLSFRIREMTSSEKIRLALVGDAAARSLLVRDPNKQVSYAAISSPSMGDSEAAAIAHSKEVSEDIIRYVGNRKEWTRSYEVKRALCFNPKCPIGISLRFLGHLRPNDLKALSRSRGVPNPLKTAAKQRLDKKAPGG